MRAIIRYSFLSRNPQTAVFHALYAIPALGTLGCSERCERASWRTSQSAFGGAYNPECCNDMLFFPIDASHFFSFYRKSCLFLFLLFPFVSDSFVSGILECWFVYECPLLFLCVLFFLFFLFFLFPVFSFIL